jgi:thioredoxin 1
MGLSASPNATRFSTALARKLLSPRPLKSEKNAALMAQEFRVVKVDVGRFDRNLDIANTYGNPIKKGIPAAVVISPKGDLIYATRAGELADARGMSESGVYDFFKQAVKGEARKP